MSDEQRLREAVQRAIQYVVLAVMENKGDLRKLAEKDLAFIQASLQPSSSSAAGAAPPITSDTRGVV